MATNDHYKEVHDLLSIDDIISKKINFKEVKNPKWADNYEFRSVEDYNEDGIAKETNRRYFIYNKQKICFVETFYNLEKTKSFEKILFQFREINRYPGRGGFDHRPKYTQHGRRVGIHVNFYNNGNLAQWDYHKSISDERTFRHGLSFVFWGNGNLRIIRKHQDEWNERYHFIIFYENEEEHFAGRIFSTTPKRRRYTEIYRIDGKNENHEVLGPYTKHGFPHHLV